MKQSEEPDCRGKKRRRLEGEGKCQKSQIDLGKRERGGKENETVRRARLPWDKGKEVGRRMKQSEEPDRFGKKRPRLDAE
jgi:hypothetical protein